MHKLWGATRKIFPRHNSQGSRWDALLSPGVLRSNRRCWQIQGLFGHSLGLSRAKKCWSRSGQHHQQVSIPGKVQRRGNVDRVGSEIGKISIHNPWGQWCASVIFCAVLGRSWSHYIFPRRLYSWYNCLCSTKRRPLPIWHKESLSDPQELPRVWYGWTVDNQHPKACEWLGQLWRPSSPLQWWSQCQMPRPNGIFIQKHNIIRSSVWYHSTRS